MLNYEIVLIDYFLRVIFQIHLIYYRFIYYILLILIDTKINYCVNI